MVRPETLNYITLLPQIQNPKTQAVPVVSAENPTTRYRLPTSCRSEESILTQSMLSRRPWQHWVFGLTLYILLRVQHLEYRLHVGLSPDIAGRGLSPVANRVLGFLGLRELGFRSSIGSS